MSSLFRRNQTMVRMSILLLGISVCLLMALAPGRAQASTYAATIALAVGTGAIVWSSWRHAQPVASLRQELYVVDHPAACGTDSTWQRWVAAGDRSDARGRTHAGFALSVAITAVVVVYAWFA